MWLVPETKLLADQALLCISGSPLCWTCFFALFVAAMWRLPAVPQQRNRQKGRCGAASDRSRKLKLQQAADMSRRARLTKAKRV